MKRVMLLVLMLALATTMAFAAGEEEASAPAAMAADGEPTYGGTFTIAPRAGNKPGSPDPADQNGGRTWYTSLIQETPMIGDFEKYGPRGSNDWDFKLIGAIPEKYWKGLLITDWEVTPTEITWTVREGINWAPNESQQSWMSVRELTAEDIVSDLLHWKNGPEGASWTNKVQDIRAVGNQVIIEFATFDTSLNLELAGRRRSHISPPELLDKGIGEWENQLGTGPFQFKEYVPDQYFTMVKNENYWNTTVVNGKEYQFPFIDEFVVPIAADFSFEVAALRTGTADGGPSVYAPSWAELDRNAPDLIQDRLAISFGAAFGLNVKRAPLDNLQVRRALFICTDVEAFNGITDPSGLMEPGALPVHWWPIFPSLKNMYTPISDLPPEVAELYSNDPELAKKILAEEGYADGFELDTTNVGGGRSELWADQLARCNVTVNISGLTGAAVREKIRNHDYHVTRHAYGAGNPVLDMPNNWSSWRVRDLNQWSDDTFDGMMRDMAGETDPDAQAAIIKEAAVYLLSQALDIPHGVKAISQAWWPWVNNYYGEFRWIHDDTYLQPYGWVWIDQDLKKSMGY